MGGVVLRVGMTGVVSRVPFPDAGAFGSMLREQIGCSVFAVVALSESLDMWVDEESLVCVDLDDQEAVLAAMNPVGCALTFRQPVFGAVVLVGRVGADSVGIDESRAERLEALCAAARRALGTELAELAARLPVPLQIQVECAYSDGHESTRSERVEVEPFTDTDDLWDQLWAHTGDGHGRGAGGDLGSWTSVRILASPDQPELVGLSNEWC